jgi:hypothetical protein
MTWTEALEVVVSRTGVERYRTLTADDWHDHEWWRAEMVRMESQPYETPIQYPPLATQIGNALKAGLQFATSGFKLATQQEHDRRLSICHTCKFWDRAQDRCTKCGCVDTWKAWVETQNCPIKIW